MKSIPLIMTNILILIFALMHLLGVNSIPIRKLSDDFTDLNTLIKPSTLQLGDISIELELGRASFDNIRCTSFHIGDISISSFHLYDDNEAASSSYDVMLDMIGLEMICEFNYWYQTALVFTGRGEGRVVSRYNDVSAVMTVTSTELPEFTAGIDVCSADINIESVNFEGGIVAWIVNAMEERLRPKMSEVAAAKLCEALKDWGNTFVNDQLDALERIVAKYPTDHVNNPLIPESTLDPPDFVSLLNLRDLDDGGTVAKYVHQGLDEVVEYFQGETYDLDNDASGPVDLNINLFIRDHLLNADDGAALTIESHQMNFLGEGGLLWEGTDRLTKTSIMLRSIRVKGLDTFVKFDPLKYIGKYSIQNEISLDHLEIEFDLTFLIQPSDRDDTVLIHPDPNFRVEENTTLSLRLDDVSAVFSLLLAVDRGLLEVVEIGSLLRTDNISPCLLSTIFDVVIAGLSIDIYDIEPLTLTGFVSPGLDRVFDGASKAAFLVFEDLLLARLPTFFDLAVRDYLNSNIIEKYWTYAENQACSWSTMGGSFGSNREDGTIDLRDLLLSPEDALETGASGKEPYGNLFSSVLMPMMNSKLISLDADGLPFLNERVIRPLTSMQSGSEGMLQFETELLAFESDSPLSSTSSSSTRIELRVSNFTIANIDTVKDPVTLLKPVSSHSLNNRVVLGPVARKPLILSSKVILAVYGKDSPLKMYNDLEIKLSLPSLELLFGVFAAIREDRLLSFPLRDVSNNFYCWLDVLPITKNGTMSNNEKFPLDLSSLAVTLSDLLFTGSCVDCSSSGLLALNDILSHIQHAGLSDMLGLRLERLVEEIIWGFWQQIETDLASVLLEASSSCPHSPTYDESKVLTHVPSPIDLKAPTLSLDAMETISGVFALAAETGFVVAAKSHQPDMVSFNDPLSAQLELDSDGSSQQYVDLMNTNAIFGQRITASLTSVLDYLKNEMDDDATGERDIGFNIAMRRFFLDEDGGMTMPLNVTVNIGGSVFHITTLRVIGLDSVSTIGALLQPVASQTLSSSLTFGRLQFTMDIRVHSPEVKAEQQESLTLSFGVHDAAVDFSVLFAADRKELRLLEMGSLLRFHKIPTCLLSHVALAEITQLVVKADSIDAPQVGNDFLSAQYQYDLNTILRSTHEEFYTDIVAGLPLMFDDTIRKIVNQAIVAQVMKAPDARAECVWTDKLIDAGTIDFRDLFLVEEDAKAQGGRGTSPFGDLFRIVYQNLNTQVLNVDSINSYIRSWTKEQSGVEGSVWYEGDMFNSSASVKVAGFRGEGKVTIADPTVENLDGVVDPLAIIKPVPNQPNELHNAISFGDGQKKFHVGARAIVELFDGEGMNIRNEIDIGLSLKSFNYLLQFFLNIPTSRLYQFPLKDFFNVNCWLTAILSPSEDLPDVASAGVVYQEFQARGLDFDTSCLSCSSPRFDDFLVHLYSGESGERDGNFLNTAFSSLIGGGFLRDRLLVEASMHCPHSDAYDPEAEWGQVLIAPVATTEAEKAEKAARDRKAMWFNAAMAIVTGCVVLTVVGAKLLAQRRHNQWIQSLDDEGYAVFHQREEQEKETEKMLTNELQSLFKSKSIPRSIRYGVPLALLADIALFAGGHFAIISSVDLTGHIAGEKFYIKDFLTFSFIVSIVRTYQGGGNEMAILMLIFSGLYPYMKLIMLAFAWLLPPRLLGGVKRRGSILLWMDVLAKLSIIDIVTMLLLAATVLVFIGGPVKALSPESSDHYSVEAIVTPAAGFYCFVMAQRISRIASNYLLEWHHRVVLLAAKELDLRTALPQAEARILSSVSIIPSNLSSQEEESKHKEEDDNQSTLPSLGWSSSNECSTERTHGSSLVLPMNEERQLAPTLGNEGIIYSNSADDDFTQASRASSQLRQKSLVQRLSRFGGIAGAVFSAITVFSVFIIGIVIGPSIKLDTRSLWSLAIESGQSFEEAIQNSFFRTISMVLLQARFVMRSSDASYIGLLLLFCLVGISSILFPLTQAIIKFGRWQRQRKRHKRRGLTKKKKKIQFPHYVKQLYLWKGMDVYIISFIIAIWQLGAVSAYVIHLYCSLLEKLFDGLAVVGLAKPSEAQCFRTQASLPLTISIICTSFTILLISFYFQASSHYKSNIKHVENMIAKDKSYHCFLHSRGLSKTRRSSSFWNLGATQLVDIVDVEEEEREDEEKIEREDERYASQGSCGIEL